MNTLKINKLFPPLSAKHVLISVIILCACIHPALQAYKLDSGGPLIPEQAAFDARHYDLNLTVDPDKQFISGTVTVKAKVLSPLKKLVLDFDATFEVSSIYIATNRGKKNLAFEYKVKEIESTGPASSIIESAGSSSKIKNSQLWIELDREYQKGETLFVAISYAGTPRKFTNTNAIGNGFIWEKTEDNQHWIGVAGQWSGADFWWPVKDHPSDEPEEGVSLHFTVPDSLEVISNGRFEGKVQNDDGTATHHWRVTTSINTYNVTFNAGPYRKIEYNYRSVSGKTFPISFWVLPENYDEGKKLFPQLIQAMNFIENLLGPYPFQGDKMAVVDVPYWGMEHQTNISYGIKTNLTTYKNMIYNGWSMVLFHELGHEWWGNLVSASDWRDLWMHESFDFYTHLLFIRQQWGEAAFHESLARHYRTGVEQKIVAPMASTSLQTTSPNTSLGKGVMLLHALHYLIGDELFVELLRRQAYPVTPTLDDVERCGQCRVTSSAEFIALAEKVSRQKLDWFFDLYLRRPELPKLVVEDRGDTLRIQWDVPKGLQFPMPVDIERNGKRERIAMPDGQAVIYKHVDDNIVVDPDFWVLRQAKPNPDAFGTLMASQ